MSLHFEILDQKRQTLLPKIKLVGESFYLAGGTALALTIGHRDSIDFDFFCEKDIDTKMLFENCVRTFSPLTVTKTQEEENTLSVTIAEEVRLSFFSYPYPLIEPSINSDGLFLASLTDIGAMKLSAILSRSTLKDYVDLYFILKTISLAELLASTNEKFGNIDQNLILKSLVYFDDIDPTEPIMYLPDFVTDFSTIKKHLEQQVISHHQQP